MRISKWFGIFNKRLEICRTEHNTVTANVNSCILHYSNSTLQLTFLTIMTFWNDSCSIECYPVLPAIPSMSSSSIKDKQYLKLQYEKHQHKRQLRFSNVRWSICDVNGWTVQSVSSWQLRGKTTLQDSYIWIPSENS